MLARWRSTVSGSCGRRGRVREGGAPVEPPTRLVAAGAVVANPFAGRFVAGPRAADRALLRAARERSYGARARAPRRSGRGRRQGRARRARRRRRARLGRLSTTSASATRCGTRSTGRRCSRRPRSAARPARRSTSRSSTGRPHRPLAPPDVRGPRPRRTARRRARDLVALAVGGAHTRGSARSAASSR